MQDALGMHLRLASDVRFFATSVVLLGATGCVSNGCFE
jgi:hypothetical protein